jgi:hypothetical protein
MDWFDQLREVLSDYYPTASPQDIVGYLRGSSDAKIWRRMAQSRTEQMLILGSVPPTEEQWAAAGVANRGLVQTIRYDDLRTFIITYGGFMVSRPWGKVSILSADVFRNYGMTVTQFRNALPDKSAQKAKLVAAMNNLIDAITRQMNAAQGEHKAEAALLTGSQGNFSGFWGYWTNHLFNTDVPPITIWSQCFAELAHARSTLKEGKFGESSKSILRARSELLKATGVYYRWKNGIAGAGTKMQATIVVVAAALMLAAAGACLATAEVPEAVAAVNKVGTLIDTADSVLADVVSTAPGGASAPSAVAYEQALEEAGETVEELLKQAE